MNTQNKERKMLLRGYIVLLTYLSFCTPANAYLEPGSGSMMIQLLLGGAAAGIIWIKLSFHKIKAFFSRSSDKSQ